MGCERHSRRLLDQETIWFLVVPSFFFLIQKDLITLFSPLQQKPRMSNSKRVGVVFSMKKDLITH